MKRLVALALLLSGCAGMQPDPTSAIRDRGPAPTNTSEIVTAYLHAVLKDPYSIQDLQIGPAQPAVQFHGLLMGGYEPKWASCVSFNAKNGFGAYAGTQPYVVWIKNGVADGMQPLNNINSENQTGC